MGLHLRRALVMAAIVGTVDAGVATAQDLRRDSAWNGVVIGAAVGAGAGALTGALTEESPAALAGVFAIAGAAIGHLVDRHTGPKRPVQPGSLVDDPLWNGALLGAGIGVGVVAIDLKRRCGTPPEKVQCTTEGTVREFIRALWWNAAIGALVDAAIPTRVPAEDAASLAHAGRHFTVQIRLRF
jgi:hypothetical protein